MNGLHRRGFSVTNLQIQGNAWYRVPAKTLSEPDHDAGHLPCDAPKEMTGDRDTDTGQADTGQADTEGQMLSVVDAEGHVIARLPSGQDPTEAARSIRLLAEASRLYDLASFAARNFRALGPRHAAGEEVDPDDLSQQPHRCSRTEMDAAVRAMLDSYAETCASLVSEIETGEPGDTAEAAA